ncbi:hypothetical protein RAS1_22720 [Phycisphaerae bacterium RAS1]|nr:hypothetical protein RAS1_22720 [Phycisphaerae bacterium RAS1]
MKNPKRSPIRWVTVMKVWHYRAKRFIRRRDGKPFRFPIFA